MSEYIPFEIQTKIIESFPIKSLIQFRSVSKRWKSLIDSSKFIAEHSVRHNQPHHILVRYKDNRERKCVSVVDNDDNFPQIKSSLTVPDTVNLLSKALIIGSSHGLVCLSGLYKDQDNRTEMIVLWNPSIRKSVSIAIPNFLCSDDGLTVVGFGMCTNTSDPKLVKINTRVDYTSGNDTYSCEVEVYTVSSGVWRSIPIDLPRKPIFCTWNQTFIDGVIYWHAFDNIEMDDGSCNMINSFDLTSEEFGEVLLPDCLVHPNGNIYISKLMESVVVINGYPEAGKPVCDIWFMSNGVTKSFKKLFNIVAPNGSIYSTVEAFRKNGEVIMEIGSIELTKLLVVEPRAKRVTDLGIYENGESVSSIDVCSYTETLLLLNQPDVVLH